MSFSNSVLISLNDEFRVRASYSAYLNETSLTFQFSPDMNDEYRSVFYLSLKGRLTEEDIKLIWGYVHIIHKMVDLRYPIMDWDFIQ